ncbi:tetratricopeptide repeat protein [bacterium]|nr:tetratricopeptide repeat protein [bacterium]
MLARNQCHPLWNLTTRRWFWLLTIVVVGLLAYSSSWQGTFVFDDWGVVIGGPWWNSGAEGWRVAISSGRPVTDFSFWLGQELWGRDAAAVHIVNLTIHLLTGCLLFLTILLTWQLPVVSQHHGGDAIDAASWSADGVLFAGVVALLWTVHPLTTQAVTYLVQRYESLSAMFIVATLWAYGQALTSRRPRLWSLLAALLSTLAIGAKQSGIVAPALVLLYERTFGTGTGWDRLNRRGLYYLATLPAVIWALQLVVPRDNAVDVQRRDVISIDTADGRGTELYTVMNDSFAGFGYQAVTPWEYLRSQGGVILHYWRLAVVPYPQCFDYGWPVAEHGVEYLPGMILVGLVLLASMLFWLRGSVWGFLGLAPFIALAPTSSILPIRDLAVEHRAYLPLMFWLLLLVGICAHYVERYKERISTAGIIVAVTIVVLMAGVGTWCRSLAYHNEATLWRTVIAVAPLNARAYYNLGHRLIEDQQPAAAVAPLKQALELATLPRNARFITPHELGNMHNRLGTAYHEQGDYVAAMSEYEQAIECDRSLGLAHMNLGNCLAILGERSRSAREYEIAAALLPQDARVRLTWADLLAEEQRYDEAIAMYTEAIERDPQLIDALMNRGTIYAQAGRYTAAARDLQDALRRLPRNSPAAVQTAKWLDAVEAAIREGL